MSKASFCMTLEFGNIRQMWSNGSERRFYFSLYTYDRSTLISMDLMIAHNLHRVESERTSRPSRVVFDFPVGILCQYFHFPQRSAAQMLGCSVITLKRVCKRHGIRWPYRSCRSSRKEGSDAHKSTYVSCRKKKRSEAGKQIMTTDAEGDRSEAEWIFWRFPYECMRQNRWYCILYYLVMTAINSLWLCSYDFGELY